MNLNNHVTVVDNGINDEADYVCVGCGSTLAILLLDAEAPCFFLLAHDAKA